LLTPTYKRAVRAASDSAHTWMQAKYDAVNPAALRSLIASGTKLMPFSTPVLEACLKAALEVYHDISATNPDFKKVYESMTAFRGDQYLWWQVAEYSYDTFMIRNRTKV
jgi:TRAP-type mannitol/chloroaromatic compound transport system substrate-binding protein